ncbi:MerR family transcriptional regulator [Williamsia sp. CHRR-6]|uniref:MerR family transcriptional regulator n=1 Tax=Williamsia sp. CHRR-6 TaxID=2835871 RepID=UPI001BDACB41|nr:MerR family transcriptional regulator [Williamsia sp. CHRR-6]MBT0566942.1 MerR family transcriptional regulator [Williamsia sp. CHRR-6]
MAEYRINELAEQSGVSVRNIRVYQDRGLLPPPRIKGRTGWYSQDHLVRLTLISRLLERGYTFATISELLQAAHYGMKVEHVLHGEPRGGRWRTFKRAATITLTELRRTLGATDTTIALSQRLGLLAKEGAQYAIKRPELLEGAEVLVKAGVDLESLLRRWERVESDLEDVADSFVSIITDKYFVDEGGLLDLEEREMAKVAELIQTVRPMAHEIVQTAFRKALDEKISVAIGEASQILGSERADLFGPRETETQDVTAGFDRSSALDEKTEGFR